MRYCICKHSEGDHVDKHCNGGKPNSQVPEQAKAVDQERHSCACTKFVAK
jgi:hypothetical protein